MDYNESCNHIQQVYYRSDNDADHKFVARNLNYIASLKPKIAVSHVQKFLDYNG